MAGEDTVGDTAAGAPESPLDWDVVVVGGGAAGLSAAVFLARYGFETAVLARGKSAIEQCACLENVLGFPVGITPERFLDLATAQVRHEGGTVRSELVERVAPREFEDLDGRGIGTAPETGGFAVETDEGSHRTRYVLVATAYDGDMVEPVADDIERGGEYGQLATDEGRTAVDGLYAAGWMTDETVHQVAVNAGHGARAAVSLVRDDLAERFWPAVADQYVDWVVHEGRYGGDDWEEHTREWFETEIRTDDADDDVAEAALEHLRSEFRAREIDAAERERRDREGQRHILAALDDDVVREYVADERTDGGERADD